MLWASTCCLACTRSSSSSYSGSSPRVRGTGASRALGDVERFIPARAGNGRQPSIPTAGMVGSSPRVRGTACAHRPVHPVLRFIPARAGNGPSWRRRADGSSPRVRGTGGRGAPTVHPRACGERILKAEVSASRGTDQKVHFIKRAGSSPRVRGTARRAPRVRGTGRFIPARAGNGPSTCLTTTPTTVHPRACGERPADQSLATVKAGSSPRVRGTVVPHHPTRSCIARAGNGRHGSSPRVRGTGQTFSSDDS